jgi:hypothetical protein
MKVLKTRRADEPDLLADPFGERATLGLERRLQILGAQFNFESNSPRIMRLVDAAFEGLPRHRLSSRVPRLSVRLNERAAAPQRSRVVPPPPQMLAAPRILAASPAGSSFVSLSAQERSALIAMPQNLLEFPYHARYEYIEFSAFTLASRSQGLTSLHAACIGRAGRGVLLMGASGAGKSTVTLLSLVRGLEIIAEDSVFVAPASLLATGLANFLHLRRESLRWIKGSADAAMIRRSPMIKRRSGVEKFEVDLRQSPYRPAPRPLRIVAIVFLSSRITRGKLTTLLSLRDRRERLTGMQAYAANQPGWNEFLKALRGIDAFELCRGRHPLESVDALQGLLATPSRSRA